MCGEGGEGEMEFFILNISFISFNISKGKGKGKTPSLSYASLYNGISIGKYYRSFSLIIQTFTHFLAFKIYLLRNAEGDIWVC